MKKTFLYVLIALLTLTLFGCVPSENPVEKDPTDEIDPIDVEESTDQWEIIQSKLTNTVPNSVDYSLELLDYDEERGATIVWSSSNPELIDHTGRYFSTSEVLPVTVTV